MNRFVSIKSFATSKSCSNKISNAKVEEKLHSCIVRLCTSQNEEVEVSAVYLDTDQEGISDGTAVVVHGAPGSHKDFKYVTPLLQKKNVRVVGINFPGMGYSSYDSRLQYNTHERVQFVEKIMETLNITDKVVILGHSRGCADVLELGVRNKNKLKGIVLANTTGFRPHRTARPQFILHFLAWLWSFTWLRFFTEPFAQTVYQLLGFRTTGKIACVCLQAMKHLPFDGLRKVVHAINDSELRVVIPFSGNDPLIETEISKEFIAAFSSNKELVCNTTEDDDDIIDVTSKALKNGERHVSIYFANEGHFLQKNRAKFLANTIHTLLTN